MLELVFLIVGLAILAAAVTVVVVRRTPADKTQTAIRAGLLDTEPTLTPPAELRPGMIGVLADGDAGLRDIKVTLLDLATRGYLVITAADTPGGRPTWELARTSKPADDPELLDYERILLDGPLRDGPASLNELHHHPDAPLETARTSLSDHIRALDWLTTDVREHHSRWGWIGALVLVLGLLATAFMLIDWVATKDFRGVIGGLGVIAAGVLLASNGRARSLFTPAGQIARAHAEQLRQELHDLRSEDIPVSAVSREFGRLLPWAIGFGSEDRLASTVDDELRRAANWGQDVRLQLGWFISGTGGPDEKTAHRVGSELARVVNRKMSSGRAKRIISHV